MHWSADRWRSDLEFEFLTPITTKILYQRFRENFRHVQSANGRQMLDLMAATGAGRDDYGSVRLRFDLFYERRGDFQRQFVF